MEHNTDIILHIHVIFTRQQLFLRPPKLISRHPNKQQDNKYLRTCIFNDLSNTLRRPRIYNCK